MSTKKEKEVTEVQAVETQAPVAEGENTCAGKPAEDVKEELPKKSDLIREQIELEKQYETESVNIIEETYSVKIGSKGNFDRLVKMVEHDFEFDYNTATGLALLYSNLKQQKPFTREDEWNGNIFLKTSSCLMLWRFIQTYKGTGFFNAKAFLEMIQFIGPDVSKACKSISDKQKVVRGLHLRLDEIDNILDEGKYENDLTEDEEKKLVEEIRGIIKQEKEMEEELNPNVEL